MHDFDKHGIQRKKSVPGVDRKAAVQILSDILADRYGLTQIHLDLLQQ